MAGQVQYSAEDALDVPTLGTYSELSTLMNMVIYFDPDNGERTT